MTKVIVEITARELDNPPMFNGEYHEDAARRYIGNRLRQAGIPVVGALTPLGVSSGVLTRHKKHWGGLIFEWEPL